ncbi:hypothetical protein Misp01_65230 [Microtetraspora sp. NBRC 13810]|nr:hypothetical protein Misp01_65230 [Microtetraspora sp. NBRC 13810]
MPDAGLAAPRGEPDSPRPGYEYRLGLFSIFTTTFVGLVGHGNDPHHALAMTIIVCAAGAEIIRRLPGPDDDDRGGPRWA